MGGLTWDTIPESVLVKVFLFLGVEDLSRCDRVCSWWHRISQIHTLWRKFVFNFRAESDGRFLKALELHAEQFKSVTLTINQEQPYNRINACSVFNHLAATRSQQLEELCIYFSGTNPVFYSGWQLLGSLRDLLGACQFLRNLDLSGLNVSLEDDLISIIASCQPLLERVNFQNDTLISRISPAAMLNLVQNCRRLIELKIYYATVSFEILEAFCEVSRPKKLEHLSLKCRSEMKYYARGVLHGDVWKEFCRRLPDARVSLHFDQTCLIDLVHAVIQAEIPAWEVCMHTSTDALLTAHIVRSAAAFYPKTLHKMVLDTRPGAVLDEALCELSSKCQSLRSLHVLCVLHTDTVHQILSQHTKMASSGDYTLRDKPAPHPWTTAAHINKVSFFPKSSWLLQ